jgi:heme/copper-type cytochrome/quinol oxidase subunit 2
VDRRVHRGVSRLGADHLGDDPLPPALARRGADAGALQPAHRGALHGRTVRDHLRALLPHGGHAGGDAAGDRPGQEQILVVGQQWSWSFNYLGKDGIDSPNAGDSGNDAFEVGTVARFPTLWLPVDTPVKFYLRSQDVIHSFWVPAFYFKMDVVPGRQNTWVTTPTKEGTYAGKCAELCGLQHSRMLFNVKVVSQAEYQQHVQQLRAQGNTGVVLGSTEPDRVAGLEPDSENGAGE